MKPSTGAPVRNHRIAVRDRPESLSAFKWNACPPSPEYPLSLDAGERMEQGLKWIKWFAVVRFGRKSSPTIGVEAVSGWSFRCLRFDPWWWGTLNRAETHRWNFNSLGRIMALNNGGVPICL
jgi:hypothetical protein